MLGTAEGTKITSKQTKASKAGPDNSWESIPEKELKQGRDYIFQSTFGKQPMRMVYAYSQCLFLH